MAELLCHCWGDYILQTDWMAREKTKHWLPALLHGFVYTLPFLLLTQSTLPLAVIAVTHAVIDHYRLTVYLTRLANWRWGKSQYGFDLRAPNWLALGLMIVVDNTVHLTINHSVLSLL